MKKKILFSLACVLLLIVGVVSVHGVTQKQTEQQDNSDSMVQNMNQQVQTEEIESIVHVDNDSSYSSGDLLYRDFSSGVEMESGMDILIERGCITNVLKNAVMVGVILDGDIYKEIPLEETDIEFTLEKNGNYVFMAVTSDGETVDITSIIKAEKSADGGMILLK